LLPALRAGQLASLIGAAGTGKTFLSGRLLRQLEAEGLRCLVATPSHKAARVARQFLADAGAQARVCTIASLLKLRPSLDRDGRLQFASRGATEAADALRGEAPHLIVADEASMISDSTARDLWALAQEVEAALLLTGDRYQLPPINAPMADLFLNPTGVRAELTEVRRTAGAVLQLANTIRTAEHPSAVWPTASVSNGGSRVVVHRWQSGWQAAAAKAICSGQWDAAPDAARVICWANRTFRIGRSTQLDGGRSVDRPGRHPGRRRSAGATSGRGLL
jgi:exodeoxyribonuclease-5